MMISDNGHIQILDSGDRHEFSTGAVRDMREGKGRCDLMPLLVVSRLLKNYREDNILSFLALFMDGQNTAHLYGALDEFSRIAYNSSADTMILEVAKHFEDGANKYGEHNWQKGIPANCYIDSALRHYFKWRRGDQDEPHDRAFVWNLLCCIWEVDYHND